MTAAPQPNPPRFAAWLFYGLPLLLWVLFAFALSTALGSYENSVSVVYAVLTFLVPDAPAPYVDTMYGIVYVFRRSATIFVYCGMTLLLLRAVQAGARRLKRRAAALAVMLGLVIAGADNFVRSRSPNRHGGWDDFAYDAGSIVFVVGIVAVFFAAKNWERARFVPPAPDTAPGAVE